MVHVGQYGRLFLLACLSTLVLVGSGIYFWNVYPRSTTVSFLDVGQGDATLIQTDTGRIILIDGGPSRVVLEGLSRHLSFFTRDIDVVIATHADADHITGLIPVLEKYHVHHIVLSPISGDTNTFASFYEAVDREVMEEGAVIHIAKRGDEMSISSSTKITVLSPRESIPQNTETNAASIVTLLETGAYSFLGTGDLPTEYERELIPLLPRHVTVYKAGHHGSKTSSGVQLLSYIKPEYAIISAGKNNTYGHPHKETIARLHEYSKEIFSTIEHGDISFSIGNSFSVELEK